MFLGQVRQIISCLDGLRTFSCCNFSRSGGFQFFKITLTVGGETVGAVHLEQNGYTQVRLQGTGGTLDKTYDLQEWV